MTLLAFAAVIVGYILTIVFFGWWGVAAVAAHLALLAAPVAWERWRGRRQ